MIIKRAKGSAKDGFSSFGSMWKKGLITDKDCMFQIKDNENVEVQSRVTAYWPDGSVKWAAHTIDSGKVSDEIELIPGKGAASRTEINDIHISELDDELFIDAGSTKITVCKKGNSLLRNFIFEDKVRIKNVKLEALIEHRKGKYDTSVTKYVGRVDAVEVKEIGPVRAVIKFSGVHQNGQDTVLPFSIITEIYKDSPELRFTYTFFIDLNEQRDFLKGLGIIAESLQKGPNYNRHIKYSVDNGFFHEAMAMLLCWHPKLDRGIYADQIEGKKLIFDQENEKDVEAINASEVMPIWDSYYLLQDSSEHFAIKKKTAKTQVCYLDCLHGNRAKGIAAVGTEYGGIMLGIKDFWQKYPSCIEFSGISKSELSSTIWLVPPQVQAYDFRHYDDTGYSQTYYEGFDEFGASAYGIANTSEFCITAFDNVIPSDETMKVFYERVQNRAIFFADPHYYHELNAFGFWSLPDKSSKAKEKLEGMLDCGFEFYKNEVEQRKWYGMFDYGDFMHTYDPYRHLWRYDMGGYAWQNTELVPTLWLWFYFLRSGRYDAFKICEAMTRHCSEVDVYHFGQYKGLGSRHNVRHWGCPCKEARIAMAGHHRMYYFFTGDYRLEDYFEEVKDADFSLLNIDPMRKAFKKEDMVYPTHARTGPDWSSFCSNWLTRWERYRDEDYLEKIKTGIEDLKATNLKLLSGSDFEYDPVSSHLRYIGDRTTGGCHLSICQGSEQIWLELTILLDDLEWNKMVADYGFLYSLSNERQNELTKGKIGNRSFGFPYMAAGIIAYAAYYYNDEELGKNVWKIIKDAILKEFGQKDFHTTVVKNSGNTHLLKEIPGISTNSMAQWCLNTIVALEFANGWIPDDF